MLYSICQRYNFESNLQLRSLKHYSVTPLYSICQRYNFESNLQHAVLWSKCYIGCIRYVKDTILKAIYNNGVPFIAGKVAVFDMSKIQF